MRYPIGNQDFRSLREDGYVYVDKTEHICRILEAGKYFFLSRPRRFGKSLTASTIQELCSGDRELFSGLWAYDNWGFAERRRPVIHVKFAESGFQTSGLAPALHKIIDAEAERLGVAVDADESYGFRFRKLVRAVAATHPSGRCIVLVDEYDKPIVNYLGELDRARENRDLLRPFFGVLKDADEFLDLVFVTGVSAFSRVSLFSDLNNLRQLTLDPLARTLTGMTEGELDIYFADAIAATGYSRDEIRRWYNGYSWGGERVYNPWSLLQLLATGRRDNYWATSGTPKFVVDHLARRGAYDLAGEHRTSTELTGFDLDRLDLATVLWQGGYLTLGAPAASVRGMAYALRYPNEEVRVTFLDALLEAYGFGEVQSPGSRVDQLYATLGQRDLKTFGELIDTLLAGIPHQLWQDATERFYHAVVHTAFTLLGAALRSEVATRRGRADVVVEAGPYVYAIEFKLLRPSVAQRADEDVRARATEALAEEALTQIAERGYLDAERGGQLEPVALAIVFDADRRAVALIREGQGR